MAILLKIVYILREDEVQLNQQKQNAFHYFNGNLMLKIVIQIIFDRIGFLIKD